MRSRLWLVAFALLAWIGIAAAGEPVFPALMGRVVDDAHLLDPARQSSLDSKLAELETKTGRQLVLVTVPTLQGYEIEDYGYRLGRAWGIGDDKKDNGALLIVAPNERRVRIEVGYGLEGTLTDAVSRLIIENAILPRFRANDYAGGIESGVDDIIRVLSGDAEDFKRRAADRGADAGAESASWQDFVWIALILGLWLFMALRRRGSGRGNIPWILPMGFPRYGGGWSGGQSGGVFSGHGGSFGGGGASGRW